MPSALGWRSGAGGEAGQLPDGQTRHLHPAHQLPDRAAGRGTPAHRPHPTPQPRHDELLHQRHDVHLARTRPGAEGPQYHRVRHVQTGAAL